ncbi:FHA domain-containing protein [Tindallia californiensis]|uniref:FHA domain-containing protein n=1 Tax=Tindallia californiensis TaxID=159292 RepID=A0A1H3P6L3_9FIRM|nr:FHA domain-containing protein [Tindallia californiensis]SDY96747.1 FHA domain-containing protein [Tindallia californiensis]
MNHQIKIVEGPDQGKVISLTEQAILVGRDATQCHLILTDEEASRQHARFSRDPTGSLWVEDLDSRNGTYVNEKPIQEARKINKKDRLRIGNNRFEIDETAATDLSPASPLVAERGSDGIGAMKKSEGSILIGRNPTNHVVINDPKVSREQARIDVYSGTCYVTNLSSHMNTCINGKPVTEPTILPPSAWIQILEYQYYFDGKALLNCQGEVVANIVSIQPVHDGKASFSKALKAPVQGVAILRWLIGSILALIPIVGFLSNGYRCRIIKNGQGQEFQLPFWQEWSSLFFTGIPFFVIRVGYYLLPMLFFLLVLFFAPPAPVESWLGLLGYLRGWLLLIGVVSILVAASIVPMALAIFADTGMLREAGKIEKAITMIRWNPKQYVSVLCLLAGLWLILGIFILFFPYAGAVAAIFGAFYIHSVASLLFGEYYSSWKTMADQNRSW